MPPRASLSIIRDGVMYFFPGLKSLNDILKIPKLIIFLNSYSAWRLSHPHLQPHRSRTSGKGCAHISFAVYSGCGFCVPAHIAGPCHRKAPSHSITAATQDTQLRVPAHQTAISFQTSLSSPAVLFPKHWQDLCCSLGKQGISLCWREPHG